MQSNILITNFWYASNYGANLTAFALYSVVSKNYKNVYLLDNLKNQNKIIYNKSFSKKFIEKYCNISKYDNNDNSILISGSDQVFNPQCEPEYLKEHLLDFAKINNKKIAFSASFGINKSKFLQDNSPKTIEHMQKSLKTFDIISIREKSGVEICKEVFGVNAQWIIDPVFILEESKYEELIQNATKNYSGKIVSYMINNPIYSYCGKKTTELFDSEESVENWLNSIKTCELFITNSFHGVCFAIIFNKPFICIVNSETGSTRYDSLFEMLGIENQITKSIHELKGDENIFKIDYQKVNKKIEEERQRGLEFLKNALEIPVQNIQEKTEVKINFLENQILESEKQNCLSFQLKKFIWNKWLVIYHMYLPKFMKSTILFFWRLIRGAKNAHRK